MREFTREEIELYDKSRYLVIVPDGFGSRGDEAMLSGLFNILNGETALLLTPNSKLWSDEMIFRTHLFSEIEISLKDASSIFTTPKHLIVIGADTIDGSCGFDAASARFKTIKSAIDAGGKVSVFCSFRSDIGDEIKQLWLSLSEKVEVLMRDDISAKNYLEQIGKKATRISDFAFYAKPIETYRAKKFSKELIEEANGRNIIGLEVSESMFCSFNTKITDSQRNLFAKKISELAVKNLDSKKNIIALVSHDIRGWDNYYSDFQYTEIIHNYLTSILGYTSVIVPPELTQVELLSVVSNFKTIICGRMHMSITALCKGIVPIVVAGKGKSYTMIDKVRGMIIERLGTDETLIIDLKDLPAVRDNVIDNTHLKNVLQDKNIFFKEKEAADMTYLRNLLNVTAIPSTLNPSELNEIALSTAMSRSTKLNEIIEIQAATLLNKNSHIEQLIISEDDLFYKLFLKSDELKNTTDDLNNKNYIIYNQTELIKSQTSHIDMMNGLVSHYSAQNDILQQIYGSKTYRISTKLSKLLRMLCPPLTIRSKIVGGTLRMPKRIKRSLATSKAKRAEANFHKNFFVNAASLSIPFCENPVVSIIIPVYNQFEYTYNCIASVIRECKGIEYEIILADDKSTDETSKISTKITGLVIKRNSENLRFLLNCNDASKSAKGKYILFLNNDTIVHENWLSSLIEIAEGDDKIGIVGSKLVYADGTLQEAGGVIWSDASGWNYGNKDDPNKPEYNYLKDVDYISGCSIMVRRNLWDDIGGFDEHFTPAYCEDSDLAFTVRKKGFRVVYQPLSVVTHFEGVSNGTDTNSGQKQYQIINSKKFAEKWKTVLAKEHLTHPYEIFNARDKSAGKPCILFIDHYLPTFDQDAGSRTVYEYLKLFVKMGYNVKFLPDNFHRTPKYTEALEQLGIEVLYGNEYANHWREWIKDNSKRINFVFTNRPHISAKYIDFLREYTDAKIVYYGHDLHSLREMREYELTKNKDLIESSKKWKSIEYSIMRLADLSYYPSKVEQDYIKKDAPELNVKVLTPYIFSDVVTPDYKLSNRKDIMFIGGFNHKPNVDAVVWFAEKVLPLVMKKLPSLVWNIMGSHPSQEVLDLQSSKITVHGFVTDEELANFYGSSRLAIVPLRYGAGIKGKVIEAMNYGIPILTTSVGAEGILNSEEFLAIEDGAEDFAKRLIALYNDEEKLREMSTAGCDYIRKYYSPENAMKIIKEDFV